MPVIRRRPAAPPAPSPAPSPARRAPARKRAAAPSAPTLAPVGAGVQLDRRMTLEYLALDEIIPYEYNPRDNEKAIPAVANSIRSFGFLIPCVIDSNNVLVAGHTRTEAARLIGMREVPCIRAEYLTQEQVNAFRLIDNKVAEQATWDHDMLAGEIGKLSELGLDYTKFGWSQAEIDCLSEVVSEECLRAPVTLDEESQRNVAARRAPITTRVVIGEFVFFIPAAQYRVWADGIRELTQYSEEAITQELKRRLGMPLV